MPMRSKLGEIPDDHFENDHEHDPERTKRLGGEDAARYLEDFKKRLQAAQSSSADPGAFEPPAPKSGV